ncbi:MAG: hypothetical protein ACE5NP_09390 [Anaerolineae bacterium]
MIKVILDYDGTLTAEEKQVNELAQKSIRTLSSEIVKAPVAEIQEEYLATQKLLLAEPHRFWWEVNGLVASYCDEGAFILNTTTLQTMIQRNPSYKRAVAAFFTEPKYDPVADCVNYLFHRNTRDLAPQFREAAKDILIRLVSHPDFVPLVLTNSLADKVETNLATIGITGIEVLADTRQYEMDPTWLVYFDHPRQGRIQIVEIDEKHRVDLRRPAYCEALLRVAEGSRGVVVVADTFSLPGALPLMLGMSFMLLKTEYTPSWCEDFVRTHPRGEVLEDLSLLVEELGWWVMSDG